MPASKPPHDPAPARSAAPAVPPARPWVPIRSLAARHRARILRHLRELDPHDRYLRFGYAATDEQIGRYVAGLDFRRDEVFGIFNRRLALVGMAHLAYAPAPQLEGRAAMAEFGVSVTRAGRGRGFGARLFEHAVLHARNRGIDTLFIHALSENAPMLRLARRAGATVERDGSESMAWLKLPLDTIGSHVDELIGEHAAELNYHLKLQRRHMHRLWAMISSPFRAGTRRPGAPGDD